MALDEFEKEQAEKKFDKLLKEMIELTKVINSEDELTGEEQKERDDFLVENGIKTSFERAKRYINGEFAETEEYFKLLMELLQPDDAFEEFLLQTVSMRIDTLGEAVLRCVENFEAVTKVRRQIRQRSQQSV